MLETMLAAPDELIVVVNKNGYIENMSQLMATFWGFRSRTPSGGMLPRSLRTREWTLWSRRAFRKRERHRISMAKDDCHPNSNPKKRNGDRRVWARFGRNTRELHMLHDKLSSIEMELNMYKRTFEKINTAKYTVDDIIGDCSIMQDLKDSVRKVAKTNSNVLIMGESGTGKELFAHSIHAGSMRRKAPFVCVNCGSIPEQLIESELFGYEEGAFTGARKGGKIGLFPAAHGGTIFLG